MDVVKTNIEKIGGVVDLVSRPGEGTTLKLKIPLTLAIIPGLVVTAGKAFDAARPAGGGERYVIPQVSLLELIRLEGDSGKRQIERIHGHPGLPPARQPAAPGLSEPRCWSCGRHARVRAWSTSWSCKPKTGSSGWWWTASATRRKSWSSRSASS